MSIKNKFDELNRTASVYFKREEGRLGLLEILPGLTLITVLLGGSLGIVLLYSFLEPAPVSAESTLTLQHYREFFETGFYLSVLLDSFVIAVITTAAALALGYPAAYYLTIMDSKWKSLYLLLMILPFWINVVVRTYAWRLILGSNGLINYFLVDITGVINSPLELLYSKAAVAVGLVHVFLPFMIIPIYISLNNVDRSGVEAAKNLGANKLVAFSEITFPQSLPGVAAGVLLVFVMSFGAFVTPSLLGGQQNIMIGNVIGQMFNELQAWGLGGAISVIFIVLVVAIVYLFNRQIGLDEIYGSGGDA
ncbi:ABC transporter permease [Halopenitus persicus]|uniref:ABC transporter permease n=1 Tax=Halopenitus persicus TaxID=1048396 RepID=UPI000BBAA8D1|nr:ABC transporter permease [Halopenitus persicus]